MNRRTTKPALSFAALAPIAALAGLALTACNPATNNAQTSSATPAEKTAQSAATRPPATVNGKPITLETVDFVARTNFNKKYAVLTPDQQAKLVEELVRIQLLADDAVAKGKDKQADVVQTIEFGRLNVLRNITISEYIKDKQPTEQELRAYYELRIKEIPRSQYRVRVIGVATQPYAEDVINELRRGGDFIAIARREASGQQAKQAAGDSGWLTLDAVAPALANAISSLKVGQYTTEPVQFPDGWGIIRLEETRTADKPEFDRLREALTRELIGKKVDTLIEELKKTAKIERTTTSG
jgi:peptidyl-prolyl cis-trans isomerase C